MAYARNHRHRTGRHRARQRLVVKGHQVLVRAAAAHKQNAIGRYVYLPEEMMMVRMTSLDQVETKILSKGHHYIQAKLNELVFFIRHGKKIPIAKKAKNTAELHTQKLLFLGWKDASYLYYEDDGISRKYDLEKNTKII